MPSAAVSSQGVMLERGDGASPTEVFTSIAEVHDISGPSESAAQIDVSSFGSTAREYILDIPDGGEVACSMNAIGKDTMQQELYADFQARTKRNYKIVCPDGETHAFLGLVIKHDRKFAMGKARTIDFTIKITGAVTTTYPV